MSDARMECAPSHSVRTAELLAGLGTAMVLDVFAAMVGRVARGATRRRRATFRAAASLSTWIAVSPLRVSVLATRVAADAGTGVPKALKFARPKF